MTALIFAIGFAFGVIFMLAFNWIAVWALWRQ